MIALALWLVAASAQEPTEPDPRAPVTAEGYGTLRYIGSLPPDFTVDAEGSTVGQGFVLDQRLRAGAILRWSGLEVGAEADLFTGQLAGDTWDLPVDEDERRRDARTAFALDGFYPRRLSLGGRLGAVQVEGGLMTSDWGLGLLANDGDRDLLFGRNDLGDRVLRFRATTMPFRAGGEPLPLFLSLAGDQVVGDDTARWARDQAAYQGIIAALYADDVGRKLGLYTVFRHQREADVSRATQVFVADLYGDLPFDVAGWRARVAAETAGIAGTTSRTLTYDTARSKLRVLSMGAAVHTEISDPAGRFTGHLRGGYASASGDPDGDVTHDFTFDRNFDVGLVLFDEVMGGIEAGTYALLVDPEHAGQPPDGVDAVLTEGSFRRAAYLQPAAQVAPLPWLDLRLGAVFAWSTGPIAQPFYTFRAGGEPRTHLDEPSSGSALGSEIDWAVHLGPWGTEDTGATWPIRPKLVLEGGHALVGDALGGGTHTLVRATATASF